MFCLFLHWSDLLWDLQTGHVADRYHAQIILLLYTMKFFVYFSETIFPKSYLAQENQESFSERCSLQGDILQGFFKSYKKYIEENHFLLLSCSLEK